MFTKTFTDPQGVTHELAVFEVLEAHANCSEVYRYPLEGMDTDPAMPSESMPKQSSIRYRMSYWVNQEARDTELLPYVLINTSPVGEWFNADTSGAEYTDLGAKAAAEHHCQTVVLT